MARVRGLHEQVRRSFWIRLMPPSCRACRRISASSEGYGLAEMALDLRLMGRKDMLNLIRLLPMTVVEFLEEWFESEQLKAALASLAIHGVTLGVMSAGTGYTLLHNWLNRGGLAHANVGKAGEITTALANAVKAYGGEIRTEAEVAHIQVDTYTCKGVVLLNGEEISAGVVISAVDPKRTFLSLVGAVNLPPEFVWKVRIDQDARLGGESAPAHRRPSWLPGRHLRARPVAEIPRAGLRRRQVR